MKELLLTLSPLIGVMVLGLIIRKLKLLKGEEIEGFKTIIIKIFLPGVLFASFSYTELSVTTWIIALVMFVICLILYLYGQLGGRLFSRLLPYEKSGAFMTGFEFGMMGVGLLSAIWGPEVLPLIMPVALGHELFIWFYYAPSLNTEESSRNDWKKIIRQFVTTPTVVGITLGIMINAIGLTSTLESSIIGGIIYGVISFVTPAVGPMILMYIGFNLKLKGMPIKETIVYSLFRWFGVIISIAIGIQVFGVIDHNLSNLFYAGFIGFMLLPPPFIIPLFIKDHDSKAFYTQLLLVNTLLSFIGFGFTLFFM